MSRTSYHRMGIALAVATALFLVFGIGALGIIGAGGPNDRMYVAVLAVLAIGTVAARLRPTGMAVTLVATAVTQMLVGVVAIGRGLHDTPGASVPEILGLSGMYAALFGLSAWMFWRAAEQRSPVPADR